MESSHSSAGTANGRVSSDGSSTGSSTTVRTTFRALAVGPSDQVEATPSFPQSMQPIGSEVTSV